MHKLILSIIAVALLQIGFITYITSDKTADNARLTSIQTNPVNPVIDSNITPEDESIEVATLDMDPFFRRDVRNFGTVRRLTKTDYSTRKKSMRVARRPRPVPTPFEPEQIIITYAAQKPYKFVEREPYKNLSVYNEPVVNKPEMSEQPAQKAEKSDSNAILNVIKKPWGWIKALGSKLK